MERPTANSAFFHAQPWTAAGPRWLTGGWHSEPLSPFLLPDLASWQTRATFLFKTQLSRGRASCPLWPLLRSHDGREGCMGGLLLFLLHQQCWPTVICSEAPLPTLMAETFLCSEFREVESFQDWCSLSCGELPQELMLSSPFSTLENDPSLLSGLKRSDRKSSPVLD